MAVKPLMTNEVGEKIVAAIKANTAADQRMTRLEESVDTLNKGGLNLGKDFIGEQVNTWLDEHPEATTTVQDKSLTAEKFTDDLKLHTIKDYVTPQMFGAKGDGVTDDTEAFQKMFEYVEKQYYTSNQYTEGLYYCFSQTVLIPKGKYFIRNVEFASGNIEIIGDNAVIISDENAFNIIGGWKTTVKNLVFVGCVEAIHIEGENQEMGKVIIDNCEFISCTSHGINITYKQSYLGTISNCRFHRCMYPIEQHASDHFIVKDCWIDERPREKDYDSSIITEGENFIMTGCLLVPRPSNYKEGCWIEGNSNITVRDTRIGGEDGSKPIIRATSTRKIYSVVDCPAAWNGDSLCTVLVSGGFRGIVIRNVKSFIDNVIPIRISETVTDAASLYDNDSYIYLDAVEGNRHLDTESNRWGLIPPELLACFKGDKRYVEFTPYLKAERYNNDDLSVHITSSGGGYYGQQNGNVRDLGFSLICRVSTLNEYFWKTVIINFYPYQHGEQLQYTFDVQGDIPKESFAFEFLGNGGSQNILAPLSMKLSVIGDYKNLEVVKINPFVLNRERQLFY